MDLGTLRAYEKYGRELTENDRVRLNRMLAEYDGGTGESYGRAIENGREAAEIAQVICYMLEQNVKLEQECVVE